MDPIESVQTALSEAAKLARIAERSARSDRARGRIAIASMKQRLEQLREDSADIRLRRSFLRYVPLSGFWTGSLDRREGEIRAAIADVKREGRKESAKVSEADAFILRAGKAADRVAKAERALDILGFPPAPVARSARALANSIVLFARSTSPASGAESRWLSDALDMTESAVAIVRDWARERARQEEAAARPSARPSPRRAIPVRPAAPALIAPSAPEKRIYLPIPSSLGPMARQGGALLDKEAPRGASGWYVTPEMDLSKVSRMLPLALRPDPSGLTFPPVPYRASGQSLAGLLSDTSWGHVRKTSYALSGRRCMVCGGRGEGGFLSEAVYPAGEGGPGVECHEVWDWKIPSEENGIGVQTLQKLLVVCRNCHVLFHSGFFMGRAREQGIEDKVAAAIEKRRMLITRMTRDQLSTSLAQSSEHLRKASGIDKWVLNLSHLSAQQFMQHHVPVVLEDNKASFPPERISGLAFETDSGRDFAARSAREVYSELLAEDAELTQTVVPFSRRS